MSDSGKKLLKRFTEAAGKAGEAVAEGLAGLLPQPQPELIPIPVRTREPRRPQPPSSPW